MSDEHVSQAILDSLPGLAQEARHMRLTRGLQEARLAEQAGVLGEPALDITGKVVRAMHPDNPLQKRSYIRLDDLIALITDQFGEEFAMTSVYDGVKREIEDLKAEIERLNDARARDAALIDDLAARDKASLTEIARLNTWIGLHRGDTLSLDIEVNTMRDHWLDAEERCKELQAEDDRLHAIIRLIAEERVALVRGAHDVPGFEACVQAEMAELMALKPA